MLCSIVILATTLVSTSNMWYETGDAMPYRRWEPAATNVACLGETMFLDSGVRRSFVLSGSVVATTHLGFVLDDGYKQAELWCRREIRPSPGDIVRVRGVLHHFNVGNQVAGVRKIDSIGHATPPAPLALSMSELTRGKGDFHCVQVDGIVTEATRDEIDSFWNWIVICKDGIHTAVCLNDPKINTKDLDRLIDAKVRVTGTAMPNGSGYRRHLGIRIEISSLSEIEILEAPPDPFAGQEVRTLREPNRKLHKPYEHRRRISGTVLAAWGGRNLFIETPGKERLRIHLSHKTEIPAPGSRISAVGFIRRNAFFIWLHNAVIRSESKPLPLSPEQATDITGLFATGPDNSRIFMPATNGRLVRLSGKVLSTFATDTHSSQLGLYSKGEVIQVELGNLRPPPANSEVEITGICVMSAENSGDENSFGHITGFSVVPRYQSDISILRQPPWWTPGRFVAAICALVLVLIAILIWTIALKRVSDRKSRDLLREKQAHLEAQLRIDERTRLAVELHDSLAQNLTGVSLQLDAAEMAEDEDRQVAHMHLDNARNALRSCREGLRYCLSDLRSRSFEDSDMTEAVAETVKPHIGRAALSVRFNVPRSKLSDTSAHAVLCIIRELAVNAVRHGKADSIHVAGEFSEGAIRFSVRDNGCGFDPDSRPGPNEGHFGLLGIKERVNAFKGSLRFESNRTSGTKVTVTLNIA